MGFISLLLYAHVFYVCVCILVGFFVVVYYGDDKVRGCGSTWERKQREEEFSVCECVSKISRKQKLVVVVSFLFSSSIKNGKN